MNLIKSTVLSIAVLSSMTIATSSLAKPAASEKQAIYATELRQSIFKLIRSNMGPLGAMAKGKIPLDTDTVEKNAIRLNQLSLMIADYSRTNTTKFDVKTEALDKIWQDPSHYAKAIEKFTLATDALIAAAKSKNEGAIKKAIGGVGKTCGGCHNDFKKD